MDYKKARKILKKITTLLDSFESLDEPISAIEGDLLRKYADQFKQAVPGSEVAQEVETKEKKETTTDQLAEVPKVKVAPVDNSVTPDPVQEKLEIQAEELVAPVDNMRVASKLNPDEIAQLNALKTAEPNHDNIQEQIEEFDAEQETLKREITEPFVKQEAMVEVVDQTTVVEVKEPKKVEVSPVQAVQDSKQETKASKKRLVVPESEYTASNIDLWKPVEIKELSHKLSFAPIKNIMKSISINERIFTQKELFGGDFDLFQSTLAKLEEMSSFDEAIAYLAEHVASKHNWEDPKKLKKAKNFVNIVQRRFL